MEKGLHLADIIVFCGAIFASLAVGIFYAYKERTHVSPYRFHRGGGKLNALPVAMSLLVTFESSIFFLGYPAEVYIHGFIFWMINIGVAIGYSTMFWISIPLFYPLQVTSVYEYLQMRHESKLIRQVAMVLGTLSMIVYAGIVMFGAAIALESVTDVHAWIFIVAMTVIAIIYTSLGGLKAVVVTDVVQGIVMIIAIFVVLIYGTLEVGGVQKVIELNKPTGRLQMVDFDPSPFTRHTFWTLVIGTGFRTVVFSFRQPVVQRLNSTKSIAEARKVAAMAIPAFVILQLSASMEGLVAYAYFASKGCDPLASGKISNPNQIIPYTVMDMFQSLPGMTGLFLAALSSATLSTISSLLSSVSAIISEDLVRPRYKEITDRKLTNISKVIVIMCGAVCIIFSLLISTIEGPFSQITSSLLGAIEGPITAIFLISIFIKFTTRKGILASTGIGVVFALWISLGYNFSQGRKKTPWLPFGPTDQCLSTNHSTMFWNSTTPINKTGNVTIVHAVSGIEEPEDASIKGLDYLYSISYNYFSFMVTTVSVIVGLIVSKMTKDDKPKKIPNYLMLKLNKRFFTCQPNYGEDFDQTDDIDVRNCEHTELKETNTDE